MKRRLVYTFFLLIAVLIPGCSERNYSEDVEAEQETVHGGIAVDPYIIGAVFEEVDANGRVIQESSPSDENGLFVFTGKPTIGNIIRIKASQSGTHLNIPFEGLLKRQVDAPGLMVVSPLTTILSDGVNAGELIDIFSDSGLQGITEDMLFEDPLNLVQFQHTVSSEQLALLQATMAVSGYFDVIADSSVTPGRLANDSRLFADLVTVALNCLNLDTIAAARSDNAAHLFDVVDLLPLESVIEAGATLMRYVAGLKKAVPDLDAGTEAKRLSGRLSELSLYHYTLRNRGNDKVASAVFLGRLPAVDSGQALLLSDTGGIIPVYPPVARIGANRSLLKGEYVNLDSSLSSSDTGVLHYSWKLLSAPENSRLEISCPNEVSFSLQPDVAGRYEIGLIVNDGRLSSNLDTMAITVLSNDSPLHPHSVPDQVAVPGDRVILDASCGSPAGSENILYSWRLITTPTSSNLQFVDPAASTAEFFPDVVGGYTFELILKDLSGNSVTDSVAVHVVPVDQLGKRLYVTSCNQCHRLRDVSECASGPYLAGKGDLLDEVFAANHFNATLTTPQIASLGDWLNLFEADPADCLNCHSLPPDGIQSPDRKGAHVIHSLLPGVGDDCSVCHNNREHNGAADVVIASAVFASKSTSFSYITESSSCSGTSCHGGKATPDWNTGSIEVNSQCQSCHSSGTGEYNGYFSGRHYSHVAVRKYSCSVCHDLDALAAEHFTNLDTPEMERTSPAGYSFGGLIKNSCHCGFRTWQ